MLRNRVRQYFQPASGDSRDFVPLLEGIVADIETVVTSNEKEALLLENTLIKRHQPRFNVNLKDDKNFLVLRLDPKAEWPRLEVVRKLGDDGAHYFGPYHSATSCRETLRVVNRHFQLRTCTDHVLHNRRRPCLQYQIKRCPAPCVLPVAREQYDDQVRDVRLFLDGKSDELMARLGARMKDAAGAHRVRAGRRHPRSDPRAGGDAGGAAGGVGGFRRSGRRRLSPRRRRAGDRRDVDPRRQAVGQPRVFVHRPGVPRRRADLVVRRPVLRHGRVGARRGVAARRHRGRGAEGGVADRTAGGGGRAQEARRGAGAPARRPPQAGRAGAQERGRQLRHAPQRARRHRAGAGQAAAPAQVAAAAAHDRVLRRLAPAGVRDGGVDGRVRRRAARQGALPHLQGPRAGRGGRGAHERRLRVDVRGAVAAVPARGEAGRRRRGSCPT